MDMLAMAAVQREMIEAELVGFSAGRGFLACGPNDAPQALSRDEAGALHVRGEEPVEAPLDDPGNGRGECRTEDKEREWVESRRAGTQVAREVSGGPRFEFVWGHVSLNAASEG
jgi:hypothetical protein